MSLLAGEHTIRHSRTEKLLGTNICEDLKWKEHLLGNEQSAIRQLTSRMNGLVQVCARASPRTRLQVANGISIYKLCYLIELSPLSSTASPPQQSSPGSNREVLVHSNTAPSG